jgi:hypothetical protein
MKRPFIYASHWKWVAAVVCLFMLCGARAFGGDLKLEAQLIWGTNDESSPDPKHKQVEQVVEKKLKSSPFKWKNYFEVNRKTFSVAKDAPAKVTLSKNCDIEVRNLGNDLVEVSLSGKGKPVGKIKQSVPKGELLVVGGNAENLTAWFVVLRQTE